MQGSKAPATLVICAAVPDGLQANGRRRHRPDLPVAWLATCEKLTTAAALAGLAEADEVVLEVPEAAVESRQSLRTMVERSREVVPGLTAVALPGPVAPSARGVLVEAGVRVAVVETLGRAARGSRRPAPVGWRCRNAAWGLWEVELAAVRQVGPLAWLGLSTLPRVRRRALHVIRAEGLAGGMQASHRLDRWLGWAGRHVDRGAATAVSVSALAAQLAGNEPAMADRSVLRAA
jgi:hypothetical protein